MVDEKSKSIDLLGVKPIADSVNTLTKGAVDGAGAFLSRICLPGAEELGFLIKDKVSNWRAQNALSVVCKAEKKFNNVKKDGDWSAHPRIVVSVIEKGSWSDDDLVQNMWAGLLSSSCSPSGNDESNLIFVNLLAQMTSTEAKILDYVCEHTDKVIDEGPWVKGEECTYTSNDLKDITGISDIHRLDIELDHLRSFQLINGGYFPNKEVAYIEPTSYALQMYVRCQGFIGSPKEYFWNRAP